MSTILMMVVVDKPGHRVVYWEHARSSSLVTLAEVSAYVDDAIAEAEQGTISYRGAASRIIGLGALDRYYDVWRSQSDELRRVTSAAGTAETASVPADCWPELREAADQLRLATRSRPTR